MMIDYVNQLLLQIDQTQVACVDCLKQEQLEMKKLPNNILVHA